MKVLILLMTLSSFFSFAEDSCPKGYLDFGDKYSANTTLARNMLLKYAKESRLALVSQDRLSEVELYSFKYYPSRSDLNTLSKILYFNLKDPSYYYYADDYENTFLIVNSTRFEDKLDQSTNLNEGLKDKPIDLMDAEVITGQDLTLENLLEGAAKANVSKNDVYNKFNFTAGEEYKEDLYERLSDLNEDYEKYIFFKTASHVDLFGVIIDFKEYLSNKNKYFNICFKPKGL